MRFRTLGVIILICLSLFVAACTGPQKKPQGKDSQEEIKQKEPVISLYIAETGEKKDIALEEYLPGVLAAEMDVDWPLEALAAQAILARTFTLEKIEEGGVEKRGTDASTAVEEFQAYNSEKINAQVKKAVEMTRGEVVKYNGQLIKAWFHADGGGKTAASAKEGLGYTQEPTPYIKSVDDPGFAVTTEENKQWRATFPLADVKRAVTNVTGAAPADISTVKISEKGPSGRATEITFGDTAVSAPALRLALGSDKMRSALLTGISIQGDSLVMEGKGYGHGVGMSQWGARALAEKGKKAEDIVKYFFKGVNITQIYK
ncbi:MAG: SpoIID/LytB domain-containing protein [Peptococcaceae bacterium]